MRDTEKIFDALLVLQYQSGKKKALSILVKRYHVKLCWQAYWYTQDLDISQDIAQDSWAVVIRKIGSLRDPNKFGSWVLRIVTRKSIDYLKNHKRQRDHLKTVKRENSMEVSLDHRETELAHVRKAIRELPRNQKEVLRLFYTEGYTLKEIGNILDISEGTVKSRLFHAREKLKRILKNS
ncbi:MAG: RNA polymerase sigma factor [Eudoraea sp.]|nr:RNA polymerase sigma factor [Eudoraea sp.]